jgi:hypothetical protein
MAQLQAVIAHRVVDGLPGVRSERLADDLRDDLEGVGNPSDKAQGLELRRIVFAGELAIGNEITRRGRVLSPPDRF